MVDRMGILHQWHDFQIDYYRKLATQWCQEHGRVYLWCLWKENGCIYSKLSDYDSEYLLRVCNSPRMGVCGYDGSAVYPDQLVPDSEIKKA